jgi:FdhD protein
LNIRSKTRHYRVRGRTRVVSEPSDLELIGEEPILFRVDDKPYAVVMRTPGEEEAHAAGFALGEGIIAVPDDLQRIGYDSVAEPNIVDLWLQPERRSRIHDRLERRFFVSQTSCGICGKELLEDLQQNLLPAEHDFEIGLDDVFVCINRLSASQQHYQTTRGSHAALIFDAQLAVVAFSEDVGRHNALDKAIGKALLERTLPDARVAVLSSRISYELVQKAARARIPVMISASRPTSLAVEMAVGLDMTLAFPASPDELVVVCGEDRIPIDSDSSW